MGIAAWAYEKDQYWLMDVIDMVKGVKHCEKQWDKEYKPEMDKRNKEITNRALPDDDLTNEV